MQFQCLIVRSYDPPSSNVLYVFIKPIEYITNVEIDILINNDTIEDDNVLHCFELGVDSSRSCSFYNLYLVMQRSDFSITFLMFQYLIDIFYNG